MQTSYISDEELVAYLDNEADFVPMQDIEYALSQDPALRNRLAALQVDLSSIQAEFQSLTPDLDLKLPEPATSRSSGRLVSIVASTAVAALALGFLIGKTQTYGPSTWTDYVASYQALYSNGTLANVQLNKAEQQIELDRVSAAIDMEIDVDRLSSFAGMTYVRAQILTYQGRPLIQLAFLSANGDPVALCIMRSQEQDGAVEISVREEMASAVWTQNGYNYIAIGGKDADVIRRMSASFFSL